MPVEFKLPDLGEGIHEGEIVEVLVSVGDRVEDGQTIMVVETDKATTEIPAPVNGVVQEIRVKPGELVKVGQVLMTFSREGEAQRPAKEPAQAPAEEPSEPPSKVGMAAETAEPVSKEEESAQLAKDMHDVTKRGREPEQEAAEVTPPKVQEPKREEAPLPAEPKREEAKEPAQPQAPSPRGEEPVPAAPSTRRLARELGVDLRQVTPSGPGGRVTPEDVQAFAKSGKPAEAPKKPPEKEAPAPPAAPSLVQAPPMPDFSQWGPVERTPLRSVRRATAKHMALAWSQIPHVSHQDVADITDLEAFRQKHKDEIKAQGGTLSITVFALKAAVAALKAFHRFNASLDTGTDEVVLKHYYHIGVAVDTDRGLIVPVIQDVDRKSITELSVDLVSLANRTREGKTELGEMLGGTFTITNVGILGGTGFTPIVNYPQVAILGLGQARLQPVVRSAQGGRFDVVPRLMLPLVIGFDHRVVDGADAARFINMIVDLLQDPEKLLMSS